MGFVIPIRDSFKKGKRGGRDRDRISPRRFYEIAVIVVLLVLVRVLLSQFRQAEQDLEAWRNYQRDLFDSYVTVELVRHHYDQVKKRFLLLEEYFEKHKERLAGSNRWDLASMASAIEKIEPPQQPRRPLNIFSLLLRSEAKLVREDTVRLRRALAENLSFKMEWERFKARKALKEQWENEDRKEQAGMGKAISPRPARQSPFQQR